LGLATECVHQVALVHQQQGGGGLAHMQLVDAASSYLFRQPVAHRFNEALNYAEELNLPWPRIWQSSRSS